MLTTNRERARSIDQATRLVLETNTFELPEVAEGTSDRVNAYLLGHSLGLPSRHSTLRVAEAQESWSKRAIRGHFEGPRPWYPFHEEARSVLARLTGGLPTEVVLMNSLTVNLHLLFQAMYQPSADRQSILIEGGAFPSDRYGVFSHIQTRGLNPSDLILEVKARPGQHILVEEDIISTIETQGSKIALVFLGAVQFTTGQALNIKRITKAAHTKGCMVGFDLAHAIGNVPLNLHEDGADFAVFCGYKYLCAGPGNGGGAWMHERHVTNPNLTHFGGWWSNDPKTRFEMGPKFEPVHTADRLSLSNPPIHSAAAALGGLDAFNEVMELNGSGLEPLWKRREELWGFLLEVLTHIKESLPNTFEIITPQAPSEHGAMLSLWIPGKAEAVEEALCKEGFVVDARGKSILRISCVPLWVTAEQIYLFGEALKRVLASEATNL